MKKLRIPPTDKPSRGTNVSERRTSISGNRIFRFACERCHLSRGEVAFTLAEVLITLGIIGVVAALTMPTLIANHKKQVTVTRLKKTYSTLSQALTTSISENGNFSEWGIGKQESDWSNYREKLSAIVKKNIIPYLNVNKDCEYNKCKNAPAFGHNDHWTGMEYLIYLVDGSRMYFFINNNNDQETGINYWHDLWVVIDINGDAKPNKLGNDVFYMVFSSSTQKINMYGAGNSRYTLYNNCKNGRKMFCGALIQSDGWQIAPDYPW